MDESRERLGEVSIPATTEFDAVDSIEYEPTADSYRVIRRAAHPEPMAYAIVEAVCVVTEQTMLDIEPLHNAINPEALETLVTDAASGSTVVRFHYAGCEIEISGSGEIIVRAIRDQQTS